MPKAQAGGIELYYEIQGQGEPLVLIPGFSNGLWIWDRQVPALARRFQTIVFDPRGVSRSDQPDEPMTIRLLAGDVAALLDAIGVGSAHILGASFGGFVAQEFALAYPQRTRSLVLCCTSFGGPRHVPPSLATLQAMASTRGLNSEERVRENLILAFSPAYIREHPEDVERIAKRRAENFVPEHAYRHQLQAAMAFDAEARVSRIEAPTLVITGDEDGIVPAENSRHLAARIPNSQLKVIAGGSHTFFIEQADEFNRTVSDFIAGNREAGIR